MFRAKELFREAFKFCVLEERPWGNEGVEHRNSDGCRVRSDVCVDVKLLAPISDIMTLTEAVIRAGEHDKLHNHKGSTLRVLCVWLAISDC